MSEPTAEPTGIAERGCVPFNIDDIAQVIDERSPDWIDGVGPLDAKPSDHARSKLDCLTCQIA